MGAWGEGIWYVGGLPMSVLMSLSVFISFLYLVAGSGLGLAVLELAAKVMHIVEKKFCKPGNRVNGDDSTGSAEEESDVEETGVDGSDNAQDRGEDPSSPENAAAAAVEEEPHPAASSPGQ